MPGFTMKKTTHRPMGDAIFSCQLRLRDAPCPVTLSNLDHLSISQFSVGHSFTLLLTILGDFINHIVAKSSQEQMGRIDAGRYITMVQHSQVSRYSTIVHAVRNAVCKLIGIGFLVNAKDAVAFGICGSSPQPATVSFLDFCPEAVGKRAHFSRTATRTTAILPTACENNTTFTKEALPTVLTGQMNKWGHEYVKMGMHAEPPILCATPGGASNAAQVPFCSFSPIIPHIERKFYAN